jgi:glycosyltransferase involved in cell wall biosynthesis
MAAVEHAPAAVDPRTLRLVYVTSRFPFTTAEPFLLAEARAIAERVAGLWIVPMRTGPLVHREARALAERTLPQPLLAPATLGAVARSPGEALAAVRAVVQSRSPSIAAKNAAVAPKAAWLGRRLRELRAEHVHVHWGGASSTLAMLAAEGAGVPWSMTLHRWDVAEDNLLARKAASARFVRTISEAGAARVRELAPEATVVVGRLGVEIPDDTELRAPDAPGAFRLLAAGGLVPVKDHASLVAALARLPARIRLDIAGDGPLRARLEADVRRHGLEERVRLLGFVQHDELVRRLRAGEWDAVVQSSLDRGELREGVPVALMEAMAAGVPVAATRSGAVHELVAPGCGLLVPAGDAGELAAALRLLAADPDLRARLAAAGRARVREHFDAARAADELLARIAGSQAAS